MSKKEKMKIEFAPGCFDEFNGTQEELDELVATLTKAVETGEIFENSIPIDLSELQESDPALYEKVVEFLDAYEPLDVDVDDEELAEKPKRKLN